MTYWVTRASGPAMQVLVDLFSHARVLSIYQRCLVGHSLCLATSYSVECTQWFSPLARTSGPNAVNCAFWLTLIARTNY